MILHTVNKSPTQANCLKSCLRVATDIDAILFIEDGCYAMLDQTLTESPRNYLYALEEDIQARGLTSKLPATVTLISYDQFVELSEQAKSIQSWY